MPDKPPPFHDPEPSPIPQNPAELAEAVSRIDLRTKQVLEVSLPRLEDGIVILDSRVSRLESKPGHVCLEGPRQRKQDEAIFTFGERIRGLVSFRNVMVGSILTVAGAAIWFALTVTNDSSSQAEKLGANTKTLDRHEKILEELPRKRDLEALQRAVSKDVSNIPNAMRELEDSEPSTPSEIDEAAKNLQKEKILKEHEYDTIRFILSRAEKRENGGGSP